jgi:hypothetical protein
MCGAEDGSLVEASALAHFCAIVAFCFSALVQTGTKLASVAWAAAAAEESSPEKHSLLHKCFLFVDNGLLQVSQIEKINSVVFFQDLGEVSVPGSGQSA